MANLKDTIIQGDLNVTGEMTVDGTVVTKSDVKVPSRSLTDSLITELNARPIQIRLERVTKIRYGEGAIIDEVEKHIYLGVPEGMSWDNIEIKYVVLRKTRRHGNEHPFQYRWHEIKDNANIPDSYGVAWPRARVIIVPDPGIDFIKDGYSYHELYGRCLFEREGGGYMTGESDLYSYIDLPEEPYGPGDYFLPGNENLKFLLSYGKAGLCLYSNGRPISNVVKLRWVDGGDGSGWEVGK